jgi:hypothetical protein
MRLWDALKQAFGGGEQGDGGLYFYLRCARCGDLVRVRVNLASELQQEFENDDFPVAYTVRKMVVDQRCFRPIEVILRFDNRRRERSREIDGGVFLSQEEYEAGAVKPVDNG